MKPEASNIFFIVELCYLSILTCFFYSRILIFFDMLYYGSVYILGSVYPYRNLFGR